MYSNKRFEPSNNYYHPQADKADKEKPGRKPLAHSWLKIPDNGQTSEKEYQHQWKGGHDYGCEEE